MRGVLDRATPAVKRRRAAADNMDRHQHIRPLAPAHQTREDWANKRSDDFGRDFNGDPEWANFAGAQIVTLGYATANAAHILSIALLVGAIVPLNLRLLGVWANGHCRIWRVCWSRWR